MYFLNQISKNYFIVIGLFFAILSFSFRFIFLKYAETSHLELLGTLLVTAPIIAVLSGVGYLKANPKLASKNHFVEINPIPLVLAALYFYFLFDNITYIFLSMQFVTIFTMKEIHYSHSLVINKTSTANWIEFYYLIANAILFLSLYFNFYGYYYFFAALSLFLFILSLKTHKIHPSYVNFKFSNSSLLPILDVLSFSSLALTIKYLAGSIFFAEFTKITFSFLPLATFLNFIIYRLIYTNLNLSFSKNSKNSILTTQFTATVLALLLHFSHKHSASLDDLRNGVAALIIGISVVSGSTIFANSRRQAIIPTTKAIALEASRTIVSIGLLVMYYLWVGAESMEYTMIAFTFSLSTLLYTLLSAWLGNPP